MRRFRRNPTEDEKAAIAAELAALKKEQQGEPARVEVGVVTMVMTGPRRRMARVE